MSFNFNNVSNVNLQQQKVFEAQKAIQKNTQKFEEAKNVQQEQNTVMTKQLQGLYNHIQNTAKTLMNEMQQNIFMRDMLNLPKEWTNLLLQFSFNENNAQIADMLKSLNLLGKNISNDVLLMLLSSNSKLNISALAGYLNKNSAQMTDKLLKLIGNGQLPQNSVAQLKNLLLIGASIASHQANPNEFMRDILQMYLPWLPLVPPKDTDLSDIEAQFTGSGTKEFQVCFYISTEHTGSFKIEIMLGNENEIYITNIRREKNKILQDELIKILKTNIEKSCINAQLFYSQKQEQEELKLKGKQLFMVNTTNSTIGLILIQMIAKIIFEFDETQAARYESLKN